MDREEGEYRISQAKRSKMPTFQQMRSLFNNLDVEIGENARLLTLRQYDLLLTSAYRWYGGHVSSWLADCFMPEGEAVSPGYEDSMSHYSILFNTWTELKEDLEAIV